MKDVQIANALELALESLEKYRGQLDQYGKHSAIESIAALEQAIKANAESVQQQSEPALVRFAANGGYDEVDPVERLRFFCSLAMQGKDWLDVEQFFDAIKQRDEPVGEVVAATGSLGDAVIIKWISEYRPSIGDLLYTSVPTIPEGWKLVPKEPTEKMIVAAWREDQYKDQDPEWRDLYYAMLSAAPTYKGEPK